jgi:protease-4
MALETDLIIDRQRLSRRVALWRTLAVIALVIAVLVALRPALHGMAAIGGRHVARLPVAGFISDNPKIVASLNDAAKDPEVAGLIVAIDSPGGSVSGGEALHDAIQAFAAVKPVAAVMGGTAASAGYMIAVPAARIFARQATITGSIGVLLQTGDISGLLKMLGIAADPLVSGPLKDQPSYVQPLSPAGRDVLQGLVMDMYDQFVTMVANGRHMDPARVRQLADGRPYTGRQALALGLVDAIGGEPEARAWMVSKNVPADLPTQDIDTESFSHRYLGGMFGGLGGGLWKALFSQGVMLDGALAVWQPGLK